MNLYRLAHIKKSCTDKKPYITQGLAAVAAHEFMSIRKEVTCMGAYRCGYCGDWHLTKRIDNEASPNFLVIPAEKIVSRDETLRRRKKRRSKHSVEKDRKFRLLLGHPRSE